jgi:hypothetical protein
MLLAAPYLLAASICTDLIADGGPGWLNLLVILFIWNALKFILIGPVSLSHLVRVRLHEAAALSHSYRMDRAGTKPLEPHKYRPRIPDRQTADATSSTPIQDCPA